MSVEDVERWVPPYVHTYALGVSIEQIVEDDDGFALEIANGTYVPEYRGVQFRARKRY